LPDAQMVWMNPDLKVYNTEVYLEGEGDYLRTGMSCKAEIIIEEYDDVIYIPVQAVLRVGGEPTVYVQRGREFEPRKVEIGLDNNRMIRIIGGLQVGEVVLLTPPLAPATVEQGAERAISETSAGEAGTEQKTRPIDKEDGKEPGTEKVEQERPKGETELTAEQRQKMREKFEKMSDEEKEEMRKKWVGKRQQQTGAGE